MLDKDLQKVSMARLTEAVKAHGLQKSLAIELNMSDTEVSRVLHEHAPRVIAVMAALNLEVVEAGHVSDLRRVLKEVL